MKLRKCYHRKSSHTGILTLMSFIGGLEWTFLLVELVLTTLGVFSMNLLLEYTWPVMFCLLNLFTFWMKRQTRNEYFMLDVYPKFQIFWLKLLLFFNELNSAHGANSVHGSNSVELSWQLLFQILNIGPVVSSTWWRCIFDLPLSFGRRN